MIGCRGCCEPAEMSRWAMEPGNVIDIVSICGPEGCAPGLCKAAGAYTEVPADVVCCAEACCTPYGATCCDGCPAGWW